MLERIFAKIAKFMPEKWRPLLSHDGFKRYFFNTGWMLGGQIFSLAASFFVGAWIARYLGPEDYGLLNYAAAFVGLFGFIAGLGVDGVVNRDLVKNPEEENELMGTGFALKILGGTLAFLAAMVANFFISSDPLTHFLIFLYGLNFFIMPFGIVHIYFQAKVKAKKNVQAQIAALLISAVLKIIFIFSGAGIAWLVAVYVLDTLWQMIGLWFAYHRDQHLASSWAFSRPLAKRLWRDGWPLMLSGAAAYIYLKIDQVMIGRILGTVEVGLYAAAVKITEIWYFLPGVICGSLFPAIINAKKTDETLYRRRLRNLYWLMLVISVVIAVPISLLAQPIILLLFGSRYILSASILRIYIWSGVGLFLGWAVNQYLMAENKTRLIFFANLAATVTNVGLNLWLIPRVGLYGAALATLVSYFIIPLAVFIFRRSGAITH